jgi:hypothetical protein
MNKVDSRDPIQRFRDLPPLTQQIVWMYLAFQRSSGELGVDPEYPGVIEHYTQYDFIQRAMTKDTFRGRARRYFTLVRLFETQSKSSVLILFHAKVYLITLFSNCFITVLAFRS